MSIPPDSLCRCGACGRELEMVFADGLSRGWPECCGHTMTVIASARPRDEAAAPLETVLGSGASRGEGR